MIHESWFMIIKNYSCLLIAIWSIFQFKQKCIYTPWHEIMYVRMSCHDYTQYIAYVSTFLFSRISVWSLPCNVCACGHESKEKCPTCFHSLHYYNNFLLDKKNRLGNLMNRECDGKSEIDWVSATLDRGTRFLITCMQGGRTIYNCRAKSASTVNIFRIFSNTSFVPSKVFAYLVSSNLLFRLVVYNMLNMLA